MRAAWLIAWKDLRASVRDRSAIAVAVVAPLVLAFILSSVLPDEELDVTYGFVDEDGGRVAQAFSTGVLDAIAKDFATVRELESRSEAVTRAKNDEIAAAFVIPEGFSEAVESGGGGTLEVVGNPESDVGAPIAESIAEAFVRELNSLSLSIATTTTLTGQQPTEEFIRRVRGVAQGIEPPVALDQESADSREFDDKTFFAAGMAVFFLFFTAQLGATGLLRERRQGTLTRLSAAPVSRNSILIGKGLFTFVLGVSSMAILIVASSLLLNASFGDRVGVSLIVLAAVFAAMGVQSLVTALARTDEQAASFGSVVAVTLGLLGGTFFPLSQAPGVIASLSYITPHAWIMRGLGDLSGGGASIGDLIPSLVALLSFGLVTISLALLFLRKRGLLA